METFNFKIVESWECSFGYSWRLLIYSCNLSISWHKHLRNNCSIVAAISIPVTVAQQVISCTCRRTSRAHSVRAWLSRNHRVTGCALGGAFTGCQTRSLCQKPFSTLILCCADTSFVTPMTCKSQIALINPKWVEISRANEENTSRCVKLETEERMPKCQHVESGTAQRRRTA